MKPIPILFLDHASGWGGAEYSLLLLLKYLNKNFWKPHLACPNGDLFQRAKKLGVTTHAIELPKLRKSQNPLISLISDSAKVSQLAQQIDARLIIANTVRASIYTSLAAKRACIPFIWYMRDFWLTESKPKNAWFDRIGKLFLCASARHVIVNSMATASHLPRCKKISVVYNGIEIDQYNPGIDSSLFRETFKIPTGVKLVGMAGRLRPWKGQKKFLAMSRIIAEQLQDIYFVIVGGDPFRIEDEYPQRLYQTVKEFGLSDRIIFTGHLEDVRPALAAMDVFVHPGDPEPFGLVNIEAMAMEKPVVAFAHGALPEIVKDGETGILVRPGEVDELAKKVKSLLNNSIRRQEMGRRGRERVNANFNIQLTAANAEKIFMEILDKDEG